MSKNKFSVKALTFDVFGTVVDWRSSIIEECEMLGQSKGICIDCEQFADRWRAGYAPSMNRVRKGELPWRNIDELHRMVLDGLLDEFGIMGLAEEDKDNLNRAWHRLEPWPDSVPGLKRLKEKYIVATLSNGNISLLVNMAKHAGLPWDVVLSSELYGHYKTDREVYLKTSSLLDLEPGEIMMCAAHRDDLDAAKAIGFRTAYISRPLEFGPVGKSDEPQDMSYDIVAGDIIELADKLGA